MALLSNTTRRGLLVGGAASAAMPAIPGGGPAWAAAAMPGIGTTAFHCGRLGGFAITSLPSHAMPLSNP